MWRTLRTFLIFVIALATALGVHIYQRLPHWAVTLPSGSRVLQVDEARRVVFTEECNEPHVYPREITVRSLDDGRYLTRSGTFHHEDYYWHDGTNCLVSPDQKYVLFTEGWRRDSRGLVGLHDFQTGKHLKEWSLEGFDAGALCFSHDGQYLYLGKDDNKPKPDPNHYIVRRWQLATQKEERFLVKREHDTSLITVLPSNDDRLIAIKTVNRRDMFHQIHLIDTQTQATLGSWECLDQALFQTSPSSFGFVAKAAENEAGVMQLSLVDGKPVVTPMGVIFNPMDEVVFYFHGKCFQYLGTSGNQTNFFTLEYRSLPEILDWCNSVTKMKLFDPNIQTGYRLDLATGTLSPGVRFHDQGYWHHDHVFTTHGIVELRPDKRLVLCNFPSPWHAWYSIGSGVIVLLVYLLLRRSLAKPRPSPSALPPSAPASSAVAPGS
jgi:hypothetical protein